MIKEVESILISEKELDEIVTRIAAEIDAAYEGKRLLLLCILKGSVVFMGDLMKKIRTPVEIEFMKVSSYGAGTQTTGNINIHLDIQKKDIHDCDILIIEDIVDSGRTLTYLCHYLTLKGARSVKTCTLLDKPSRRVVPFVPDFVGRVIPDQFVVGYGLDYDEKFRARPYVGILKPEVYR